MSGLHEVDCGGCGQRHVTSVEQARKQRVLRCECGQFVRLDRALAELRSDPAPAQPVELAAADEDDEEEQTHMVSSLAAVAAMRGHARPRATQSSLHDDERISRPVPRSTLHSLPPSPSRPASMPPPSLGEKPLWYVDLGGSETVEMTIEQLIVARRSGKLGEGALVWREGMPRWRPVGTLIPASSAARHTPPPPAPPVPSRPAPPPAPSRTAPSRSAPPGTTRPPLPSRVPEALPEPSAQSFSSYEKPLATLEFALEKSAESALDEAVRSPLPTHARSLSPLPSSGRTPSRPARAPTPVPQPATWNSQPPAPVTPAQPPALAVELPPAPLVPRRTTPLPTPLPSFTIDRASQPAGEHSLLDWLGDRPRWVSACIALVICVTASGSGAFLVRSLKQRRQPPTLASSAASQSAPSAIAARRPPSTAPAAAANQPLVVDLESLSVEHSTRHSAARWTAPVKNGSATDAKAVSDESSDNAAPAVSTSPRPRNADLPSAAHANPYTTGSDDNSAKKPATTGSDEPGF